MHVGPGLSETLTVHRDLLSYHSDYFKVVLSRNLTEVNNGGITYPETKPTVVRAYMQWLYSQSSGAPTSERSRNAGEDDQILAAELYNFAYENSTRQLRNEIVDYFIHHFGNREAPLPSFSAVAAAWKRSNSPLARLIVDILGWYWSRETAQQDLPLPVEVYNQVLNMCTLHLELQRDMRKTTAVVPTPWGKDACQYHEHRDYAEKEMCEEQRSRRGSRANR